jgi:hypothetical protein
MGIWDRVPERAVARYSEKDCGKAIRMLLTPYCDDFYSHETGELGHWEGEKGKRFFVPRRGGTRTTIGYPDLTFYISDPFQITITVEVKGDKTAIKAGQWEYALIRMQRGDPHLIVRSPEALCNGLRYLGLMAEPVLRKPPIVPDPRWLPDNMAFLERTRMRLWERLHPFSFWHEECPAYAMIYEPEWSSRRKLVLPEDVPAVVEKDKLKRARRNVQKRARSKTDMRKRRRPSR